MNSKVVMRILLCTLAVMLLCMTKLWAQDVDTVERHVDGRNPLCGIVEPCVPILFPPQVVKALTDREFSSTLSFTQLLFATYDSKGVIQRVDVTRINHSLHSYRGKNRRLLSMAVSAVKEYAKSHVVGAHVRSEFLTSGQDRRDASYGSKSPFTTDEHRLHRAGSLYVVMTFSTDDPFGFNYDAAHVFVYGPVSK